MPDNGRDTCFEISLHHSSTWSSNGESSHLVKLPIVESEPVICSGRVAPLRRVSA
jgi:hypothetical protein